MAATSDSDSSSSSSSSDEGESLAERGNNDESAAPTNDETADAPVTEDMVENVEAEDDAIYERVQNDSNDTERDSCKIFLSRIPQAFNDEVITRILEEQFGNGCVVEVSIACVGDREDNVQETKSGKDTKDKEHRGFGFVTFATAAQHQAAIEAGTVRGSVKSASKRKHTLYIRPVVRDDENTYGGGTAENKNLCFLWKKNRCPYGDDCKFVHEGDGGCIEKDDASKKKKQKCFSFKKNGKCKLGDECPYSHDVVASKTESAADVCTKVEQPDKKKDKSLKDCINWKNKGKCRKGDKCPFRHDESIRDKLLQKKKGKEDDEENKRKRENKTRQTLSIRVFGLNYETSQDDIRKFFAHCGPIMEITFPTWEDSGRSKGYCGVLFQSPKAVNKAIELDGNELDGRWLRIQEGKMFLKKWEEVENGRRKGGEEDDKEEQPLVGEYGQAVKKRKKHGFKD